MCVCVKNVTRLQLVCIITISSKAAWPFRCGHDATEDDDEIKPMQVIRIYRVSLFCIEFRDQWRKETPAESAPQESRNRATLKFVVVSSRIYSVLLTEGIFLDPCYEKCE